MALHVCIIPLGGIYQPLWGKRLSFCWFYVVKVLWDFLMLLNVSIFEENVIWMFLVSLSMLWWKFCYFLKNKKRNWILKTKNNNECSYTTGFKDVPLRKSFDRIYFSLFFYVYSHSEIILSDCSILHDTEHFLITQLTKKCLNLTPKRRQ